jgi:hypothetical protein
VAKSYDRASKRAAILIWISFSLCWAAALTLPYYWSWDRIAAKADMLALITGLLLWAEWSWWKLSFGVVRRIRNLPAPAHEEI